MTAQRTQHCIWEQAYGKPNAYCCLFNADCRHCPFAANTSEYGNFEKASSLPTPCWLSREHLWLAAGQEDTVLIGLDHFLASALRHIRSIVLPCNNVGIIAGKTCVWLFDIFGAIALRTPVGGTVIRCNQELIRRPNLVLKAPYGRGWLFEARTREKWQNSLMQGAAAQEFIRLSQNKLKDKVLAELAPAEPAMAAAADGGALDSELAFREMPKRYFELLAETMHETQDK